MTPMRCTLATCVALLAGCSSELVEQRPVDPLASHESRIDGSSFVDKVTAGYQAWFSCPTQGGRWTHWSGETPSPGHVTFELYPDVREYDPSVLCDTALGPLNNGQPSRLYNANTQQVVDTHFRWMQEYGIDGVGLQRFVVGLGSSGSGEIISKVRDAAERYGRIFYVMYDTSGAHSDWAERIKNDWHDVIEGQVRATGSGQYARQGGRAVVNIWGLGGGNNPGTAAETLELINWFHARNVYVAGGVPYHWRTSPPAGFDAVFRALDMIQPWSVGGFATDADVDSHFASVVHDDLVETRARGQDYQRVIWPGFSWSNWNGPPRNGIPRRAGKFFWRQAYRAAQAQVSTYIAMFDEYDEGTAIAKAAESSAMAPRDQWFLTLDADGTAVSSDFYLRLAGAATQMSKGQLPITDLVPIPTGAQPPPPPPPGSAPVPVPPDAVRLGSGAALLPNARLTSAGGRFTLTYQSDGNLVLYGPGGPVWASDTGGRVPGSVVMQGDGNLVINSSSGPVWASHTDGHPGAFLALLSNGLVAIYGAGGTSVLWQLGGASSGTPPPPPPPPPGNDTARLTPGQGLGVNARLTSPDGRWFLTYQSDGNLVLYGPSGPAWATYTFGAPGSAPFQSDGNFVVYDGSGAAVWASHTEGRSAGTLELGNDGALVIRSTAGATLWKP